MTPLVLHPRASMARKLYVSGNMGVGAFRKNYGGARNDGVLPLPPRHRFRFRRSRYP